MRSVALNQMFVKHYMGFRESKLPIVTSIVTSPLVLPDGTLLAQQGLNKQLGSVFRLQPELVALLPRAENCTPGAVGTAMKFLMDEWLCDVAMDYPSKCILISAVLTIIERALLPQRPAYFITAGKRGGGKTTTIQMLFLAATGYRAPAAAWSVSEEERRKTLFSYLSEGVSAVVWDNIPLGSMISCPSIEKCLTAATYSDRVLGETRSRTVPSTTVIVFTGNNIAPRGDLASRSLQARILVDRPDPENRPFKHADPIAWTFNHRGEILKSLYTILLGNPRLRDSGAEQAGTRFKEWYHLVGSAVEHAAKQHAILTEEEVKWMIADIPSCRPEPISFRDIFKAGEVNEEQSGGLSAVLDLMRSKWPAGCQSAEVATYLNEPSGGAIEFKAAIELASGKSLQVITSTKVTWALKALVDAPVPVGDRGDVLMLAYAADKNGRGGTFRVRPSKNP